ncbi:hypothetical protein [Micromonospora sp. DT231]|uniref:hypothetical protein n=1 Tax=Micromonospora sp. DT231 TaxID=3416526 RepID=UPI003CEA5790
MAVHIRDAQDNPNPTYPLVSPPRDKRIPGKFTGSRTDPPLHRILNTDPQYKENGYGFVFYGYDGCVNGGAPGCRPGPDRFRMVVWTGGPNSYPTEATTLDTSRGADYDVDAAVPKTITSGRVNIQK